MEIEERLDKVSIELKEAKNKLSTCQQEIDEI
jgi:hypothetical protein